MQKALIHIRCNTGKVRREKRNGRDLIIVPSFTLKDGIVMNRVKYERDEIEKAYKSFERTPAPLGHPMVNGKFVSASDPEGIARGWVGSWNENVRREGDRIAIDKVIDVEQAKQLEGGRAILNAIERGEAIHSSTGLLCMLDAVSGNDDYDYVARNMVGDHDAWLLNERGAATPDDGVGILVNTNLEDGEEQIEVINSYYDDESVDAEIGYALERMMRAQERKDRLPLIERIKSFMNKVVQGDPTPDDIAEGVALNTNEDDMDKEHFDALQVRVNALADTVGGIPDVIAEAVANALKPIVEAQEASAAQEKAKQDAEHTALVNRAVEAGILDEETAKGASVAVLNSLLSREPLKAFNVNGAYKPAGEFAHFSQLPE